ncbi:MAG: hypothetical protein FWD60_11480, partial [Candidatus Azobacteroides sp.]|nr:hypothetical protein [Candidatus Azobacteroides sp.]
MKKVLFILIIFLSSIQSYPQTALNTNPAVTGLLETIDNLSPEIKEKMDAAFSAADAVEKAGAYINSLSDLIAGETIPLPVGIKKGDYSLIIRKITWDTEKKKQIIFASCAFRFKDTGQKIAFEGQAELNGNNGLGPSGRLELITPVRRNIGKESTLIINAGTAVNFGCGGIESFDAKISWVTTSPNI